MNSVSFTGNAGRDAEIRYLQSGKQVANFTVAIYNGQDKPPIWVPVTAWDKTAEIAADRVKKGSRVGIEGRFHVEEWTDKNTGESRSKLCVTANRVEVFERSETAGRGGGLVDNPQRSAQPAKNAQTGWNSAPTNNDFDDDDVPF